MSRSSYFQVSADTSSSNGQYHTRHNYPAPQSNNKVSIVAISHWKQGKHSLTAGQAMFPPKCLDHHQRAAQIMSYTPLCAISCHFLAIKTPVLRVAGSFWADVNLVRTNLEDCDSLLDNGFADVSLRVHLQQIS